MSVRAMISPGHGFAIGLHLCLWAGLAILTWDAANVFGTVVGALLASFLLLLPAAFCVGLLWRYAELIRDAVTWVRHRRVFPARAGMSR